MKFFCRDTTVLYSLSDSPVCATKLYLTIPVILHYLDLHNNINLWAVKRFLCDSFATNCRDYRVFSISIAWRGAGMIAEENKIVTKTRVVCIFRIFLFQRLYAYAFYFNFQIWEKLRVTLLQDNSNRGQVGCFLEQAWTNICIRRHRANRCNVVIFWFNLAIHVDITRLA